jgi:hypothetical protein
MHDCKTLQSFFVYAYAKPMAWQRLGHPTWPEFHRLIDYVVFE